MRNLVLLFVFFCASALQSNAQDKWYAGGSYLPGVSKVFYRVIDRNHQNSIVYGNNRAFVGLKLGNFFSVETGINNTTVKYKYYVSPVNGYLKYKLYLVSIPLSLQYSKLFYYRVGLNASIPYLFLYRGNYTILDKLEVKFTPSIQFGYNFKLNEKSKVILGTYFHLSRIVSPYHRNVGFEVGYVSFFCKKRE